MKGLKELLLKEEERLKEIVNKTKMRLEDVPEGSLRISKSNAHFQFYHCTDENKVGKYIAKGNEAFIKRL